MKRKSIVSAAFLLLIFSSTVRAQDAGMLLKKKQLDIGAEIYMNVSCVNKVKNACASFLTPVGHYGLTNRVTLSAAAVPSDVEIGSISSKNGSFNSIGLKGILNESDNLYTGVFLKYYNFLIFNPNRFAWYDDVPGSYNSIKLKVFNSGLYIGFKSRKNNPYIGLKFVSHTRKLYNSANQAERKIKTNRIGLIAGLRFELSDKFDFTLEADSALDFGMGMAILYKSR